MGHPTGYFGLAAIVKCHPAAPDGKCSAKPSIRFTLARTEKLTGESVNGKSPGVEIYDRLRFFAVTGVCGDFHEIAKCQDAIDQFCSTYWPATTTEPTASRNCRSQDVAAQRQAILWLRCRQLSAVRVGTTRLFTPPVFSFWDSA